MHVCPESKLAADLVQVNIRVSLLLASYAPPPSVSFFRLLLLFFLFVFRYTSLWNASRAEWITQLTRLSQLAEVLFIFRKNITTNTFLRPVVAMFSNETPEHRVTRNKQR